MMLIKRVTFTLIILFVFTIVAKAQNKIPFSKKVYLLEDTLKVLGKRLVNGEDEVERKNANYAFIKKLVALLKTPNSFNFPFDSVKTMSIVTDPGKKFRIFTWHVANNDKTCRFYGAIQVYNIQKLELYPLTDRSDDILTPADSTLKPEKWYGAQYYKLIPGIDKTKPHFILLGWKGNTAKTTKKVIEVFRFVNGKPVFGADVFVYKTKTPKRIIFEFNAQVNMLLRHLPEKNWIVFDHLALNNVKAATSVAENYGPDLSYDALKFVGSKWTLMENIDLRNEKSAMDALFIDPKDKNLK